MKKRGKRKKRKKNAARKKSRQTRASRSAAAKKGWRKRKRKKNPSSSRKRRKSTSPKRAKRRASSTRRRSSRRRSTRRRKNPVTVTLDFQSLTDALPATIAGGVGFGLSGAVDAIAGGRISEKIAEIFAGKGENGKQKRPNYKDRAQAEAVLDAGSFFGLWLITDRFETLEPYRTPLLIGSGIRLVRSLADAIIAPKEPTGLAAGMRRVLDLPAIQTQGINDKYANRLPAEKVLLVQWDYRQKAYVGSDGKPVKYTIDKDGVALAGEKILIDRDSGQVIQHAKGHLSGMGAPLEEWELALNGVEHWQEPPMLPPASGMDGIEQWEEGPVYDMSGDVEPMFSRDFEPAF